MVDLYAMEYRGYWQMIASEMTQKLRPQFEMMCDEQSLREMKRQRLSINDFEWVNGTKSRTTLRVGAHLYNVTHTL